MQTEQQDSVGYWAMEKHGLAPGAGRGAALGEKPPAVAVGEVPGVPTRAAWLPSPPPWRQRSALRSTASSWRKTPELLLPPVVMRILWPVLTCF